ncbi:EPIDERMAL PATTERNING FACTOR-like protein 2 [Primulina huaijiensis]|uniref:EPIDERMAL PATTERNING FACTOR-like protein 2 n=1 Tax=Primulina huaijiensis TaxID=1492673 RepID=UPI003CC79015
MACMKLMAFVFLAISPGLNFDQKLLVQGRQSGKFSDFTEVQSRNNGEENASKVRLLIGSRPPRCERMCQSCGHCEAVQVPISPPMRYLHHFKGSHFYTIPTTKYAYSRREDISNYKPMCWKCKCGDFIVNP